MRLWLTLTAIAMTIAAAPRAQAGVIADSVADFSLVQGQGGWFYGIYDQTANGLPYNANEFAEFDIADAATNAWMASSSVVPGTDPTGRDNRTFLSLNSVGGHPTGVDIDGQDRIVWAVRRYVSSVSGLVDVEYDVRKLNTTNPNGGGITGRIFVDGAELLTQFIANDDGIGQQGVRRVSVVAGTRIDFAIDSLGVESPRDGVYSPRADGSHFSAVISEAVAVPEPGSLWFAGLLVTGLFLRQVSAGSPVRTDRGRARVD